MHDGHGIRVLGRPRQAPAEERVELAQASTAHGDGEDVGLQLRRLGSGSSTFIDPTAGYA